MEIACVNINGFRSVCKSYNNPKKKDPHPNVTQKEIDFHKLVDNFDVICIQETRLNKLEEIEKCIKVLEDKGWCVEFNHSSGKKGYSGVAIMSRIKIDKVKEFVDDNDEGRLIRCNIGKYAIYSCYVPRIESIPSPRMEYKRSILKQLERDVKRQSHPIVTGDFNTSLGPLDMHNWDKLNPEKHGTISYEERDAVGTFLKNCNLYDTFRILNPNKIEYTFFRYPTLKKQNKGWRIDYIFVPNGMKVKEADVLQKYNIADHSVIYIKI